MLCTSIRRSMIEINASEGEGVFRHTVTFLLASDYKKAVIGDVFYVDGGFYIEGLVFR